MAAGQLHRLAGLREACALTRADVVFSLAEVLSLIFALVSVYMTIFCFVGGQWHAVSQLWPA